MNHPFSPFLESRRPLIKKLVNDLRKELRYVSVLGSDCSGLLYNVHRSGSSLNDSSWKERGFLIRGHNGHTYFEYACNDINDQVYSQVKDRVLQEAKAALALTKSPFLKVVDCPILPAQPLVKSFYRNLETKEFSHEEVFQRLHKLKEAALGSDARIMNVYLSLEHFEVSKIFISSDKELDQFYTWNNGSAFVIAANEETSESCHEGFSALSLEKVFALLEEKAHQAAIMAVRLLSSKKVIPGEYDVITAPDITGLIAHEAFGHGLEMDMFVKQRALAAAYMNKKVASNIVTMKEGAASYQDVAAYFFDDEGELAQDITLIKDGILVSGISDAIAALKLNTHPTGNGRRQSYKNKAYTRMTHTYILPRNDSLQDMIASIQHGYLLRGLSSGMEDPKNWGIQCIATLGEEIKDGKLTGQLISHVIMTGYVPDLLQSISMISADLEVYGSGACGKGYKEWVKNSCGGPYLKAKVKLG